WVALGGGGYDWARVVPRSWAIVWSEMSGRQLPERVPETWNIRWSDDARQHDFWPMPALILDDTAAWPLIPRRTEIEETNRGRAEALRRLIVPSLVRHMYPAYRIDAAPPKLPDVVLQAGGDVPESRVARLDSSRGPVVLRDLCPPSLIESLPPDPGLAAFTRRPE